MNLIEEYKVFVVEELSQGTIKRYVREIEAFESVFDASTATYTGLTEYFVEVSESVAGAVKSALLSYFNFLVVKGVRKDNPVNAIEVKPQSKDVDFTALLDSEELDEIITQKENDKERYEILKWRNLLLISFVRYQALTNVDMLKLEIESIIDDEKIRVRATSKSNANTYDLNPKQIKYWFKYKSVRDRIVKGETTQLFLNKLGNPITGDGITSVIETLKPYFPKNKVHNKLIRQAVIVEFAKKSDDLLQTQKFARHKWSSTTAKYFEFISDELRDEVERLHPFNMM